MADWGTVALVIVTVTVFIWRFARTHQLYRTSLQAHSTGLEPSPSFHPDDARGFIMQALFGRRVVRPSSFLIRALVFLVATVCLFPFKDYGPTLYWLVVVLVSVYVPWCILHGLVLKRRLLAHGAS